MKKVLLSVMALMALGFANAQETRTETTGPGFSAGDVFISGSVGFRTQKTGDMKSNGFNITPRAAYFITDNIALGLQAGYGQSKTESTYDVYLGTPLYNESESNSFSVGAFGRYYFTPKNAFSFFGQVGIGYSSTKFENTSTSVVYFPDPYFIVEKNEGKTNSFNVAFAPGISYFVSDNLALEATFGILNYNTAKPDTDGAESTNTFNIALEMENINFGIVYKF